MASVAEISEKLFETEVLNSELPVLLDFFAPWCGPCRALAPVLEELSKDPDYKDKVKILKLNVDENAELAKKYNIRSIPTLILFKNGSQLTTVSGGKSKSELIKILRENI